MSSGGNVVDSKIVELSLNNKDFENNARTSISTLDKLKDALKFDKSYKAFDDINSSIKNVNTGTLVHGVEKIQASFSALDVIAMRTLSNITDSIERTAVAFTKSLTIDQVSAGWSKYAEKTSAVQTIMSATAQNFEDQATQMEAVNKQLEKLNWFTDETSYNFLDMVNNIGKFTSNQVSLEDSVTAMEGISTWAAKSGASIGEAGRAMYNLSQAMAVGSVKLMDWKSIENANMATAEFKQTALETAVELGTLTKVTDDLYKTTKGTEVSVKGFNQTLSEGWFTSEVLIDTLDKYGGFTNELHDAMEQLENEITTSSMLEFVDQFADSSIDWKEATRETGLSMEELRPILERLSSEELEFGRKAFEAAQEAKTFEEAISSVKDAASTGWMNTFELMFGDYLQAKELWTTLANDLYDIFAEGGNTRNALLKDAFNYSESITNEEWAKITKSGLASPDFIKAVLKSAQAHNDAVIDIEGGRKQLVAALQGEMITIDDLNSAFNNLFGAEVDNELSKQIEAAKETDEEFKTLYDTVSKYENDDLSKIIFGDGAYTEGYEELEAALDGMLKKLGMSQDEGKNLVDVLTGQSEASAEVAKAISEMSDEELKQIGFTQQNIDKLREAVKEGKTASEVFSEIGIVKKTGGQLWTESLYNGMETLVALVNTIREAWAEVFPPTTASQIYSFLEALNSGSAALLEFASGSDELKAILHGLFSAFDLVFGIVTGIIHGGFEVVSTVLDTLGVNILAIVGKVGALTESFRNWFNQNEIVAKSISFAVGWARKGATAVKNWANSFKRILPASQNLTRFRIAFTWAFKELGPYLEVGKEKLKSFQQKVEDMGGLNLGNFGEVMKMFKDDLLEYIANFPGFKFIKAAWDLFVEDMRTKLAAVGIDLDKISEAIGNFVSLIKMGFTFLGSSAISAAGKVGELFSSFANIPKIKENLARFKNGFKQAFGKLPELFEGGQQRISGFIEKVKAMGGLTLGNFGEVAKTFKDDVIDYFVNFKGFDGLKKAFGLLWGDVKVGLKSIGIDVDGISEKFETWKNTLMEKLQPHIDSFSEGFKKAFESIPNFIEHIKEKFGEFKEKIGELDGISLDNIIEVITAFKDTVLQGFADWDGFEGIKTAFEGLKTDIKSHLDAIGLDLDNMTDKFDTFRQDISEKLSSIKVPESLQTLVDTLASLIAPKKKDGDKIESLQKDLHSLKTGADETEGIGTIISNAFESIANCVGKVKPGDIVKIVAALFLFKKVKGISSIFFDIKNVFKQISRELKTRQLLEVAASIGILAMALGYLSSLDSGSVENAADAMKDIVYMLTVLTIAATKFGGKGESLKNIGIGIVALAAAIVLIVAALKLLEFVNMEGINERLLLLGVIFVSLLGVAKVMSELGGKGAMRTGVGILALVASMYLVIGLIELLSHWHMEFKTAMAALGKLMAIFGLVVLMMAATKLAGKHALGAAAAIAAVGLAFVLIAASMKILETIGPDALARTLICITIIGGIIAGIVYVSKSVGHATGPIVAIGAAFMLLAASLAVLSLLPDPKRLLLATGCLAAVMIVLGLVIGIAGLTKPAMGSMIALAAVIAVMGLVLWGLSSIPSDKLITAAASLSVALLAVSAALFILSLVGKAAVSALVGLGVLAIAIAAFAALAVGLGALADNTDMKKFLDKGIPILEEIAEGFGRFFGKLLGGFIAGIDEASMDEIIDSIVQLGESLKAFGEALDGLPADELRTHAGTIGILVGAINDMEPPIDIVNAVGDKVGTDIDQEIDIYTGGIEKLGDALKSFGDAVDDLNPYKLQLHAGVVKALIEYINGMDKTTGIISAIAGYVTDESVSTYTEGIKKLGEGLGDFGKAVKDLDPNTLNLHAETVGDLITYIDKMPKVSGIGEHLALFFDKQPDFDGYSAGFKILGEGLKGFGEEMAGLDPEKINLHAETVGNLVSYINKMDKESKINNAFLDWFDTEPAIGEYAAGFMKLGIGLSFFGSMLKGLDPVTLGINADTVNTLVTTIEGIPKAGGVANAIAEFFTGYTKVDAYKEDMKDLGEGLKNFGNELGDVSVEKVRKAADAAKVLVEVGQGLNGVQLGGWFKDSDYTTFAGEMSGLGQSLADFASAELDIDKLEVMADAASLLARAGFVLSDLDLEYGDLGNATLVENFTKNIQTLIDTFNQLTGFTASEGVEAFKTSVTSMSELKFGEMGEAAADAAAKGAEGQTDAVNASGEGIGNALVSGVSSAEGDMTTAAGSVIDAALAVAESRASDFEPKGRALIEQLAAGMTNSSAAKDAANQVVSDAADAAASSSSISKFYTAGLSMMNKLKEGIDAGGASALRAAVQWADKIQRAFNNIKKPNADKPSGDVPPNLVSGGVIDIYTQMVNGYHQNAQNLETALKEFNDAIHTNIDTQPVIRPVLDISDIEVGANAIRDALSNSVAIGLGSNVGVITGNMSGSGDRTDDVIDAINAIGKSLASGTGDTYILDGITYDDGSGVADALRTLVNAVRVGRRA